MARGTIRQRSKVRKDSWTVQIYLGIDPKTGKKRYYSEAVKGTKAKAERRKTELLHQVDTNSFVEPSALTVGEYLEKWLRESVKGRVKNRTYEGYEGNVRRYLVPRLGAIPLGKLTTQHVQVMESELLEGGGLKGKPLSAQTVLQAHRVLTKALNDTATLNIDKPNVAQSVKPPRPSKFEHQTLDWDDVQAFVDGISDHSFRTLVLLAIQTGLRRSELLGLQWRDAYLSAGMLSVRRALIKLPSGELELNEPKSRRGRVVHLPPESVGELEIHRKRGGGEQTGNGNFVFCHSDGSPLDPDLVTQAFKRMAKRAGLGQLRLHDLRHTHASLMLSKGIHLKIVSERLGHSNIGITGDLYSHVLPSVQEEAVSQFGAEWRKRNGKRMANSDETG